MLSKAYLSLSLSLWVCWSHHYLPSFTPSKILYNTPTHFPKTETNKNISIDISFSGIQICNPEMFLTHPHYWRRRLSINPQALLLLLLIILCFFFTHHCDASRFSSSSVFYRNPNNDHNNNTMMRRGHFLGFLPRHLPVPASAPSRKHNDIGIQALLSPWSLYLSLDYIYYYIYNYSLCNACTHTHKKEYKTIHR